MYYGGYYDKIYVFDPTIEWDPVYKALELHPKRVFNYFSDKELFNIINGHLENRRKGINERILIIFDDCGAEDKFKRAGHYNNIMDKASFLARHWGISIWWVVQDICSLSNPVRKNADGAAIFETLNYQELCTLYQTFGMGKLDTFRRLLLQATREDFSFLFVHRQAARTKYFRKFNYLLVPHLW